MHALRLCSLCWSSVSTTVFLISCSSACRDKYRVLERFEVQVPDTQLDLLDRLDGEWAKFQVSAMSACMLRASCHLCSTLRQLT